MESTLSATWTSKARDLIGTIFEHVWVDETRLAAAMRRMLARMRGAAAQSVARLMADHGRQLDGWLSELREQATDVGITVDSGFFAEEDRRRDSAAATPRAILAEVLSLHDRLAERLRDDLSTLEECDAGRVSSRLTGLLEFHETTAWMLRVLLTSPELARVQ